MRIPLRRRKPNVEFGTKEVFMKEDNRPDSDAAQPRGSTADLCVMLAAHRAFRRDVTTLAQRYRGERKPWYDAVSRW
jgi:hypothetical protein